MGFSVDWLTLREPADRAARDRCMLHRGADIATGGGLVLDLGSGTGAMARAFAAEGFGDLDWRFFDNDPTLLAAARDRHPEAEIVPGELGEIETLPMDGVSLVTASALLDLMPETWIDALAARLQRNRIAFYASLSYDGRMVWTPANDADTAVKQHFNQHQRGDKGLGKALGPNAGGRCLQLFEERGFTVSTAKSPWIITPDQKALQEALIEGIGQAASEAGYPGAAGWTASRHDLAGQTEAVIGHVDLLALPLADGP